MMILPCVLLTRHLGSSGRASTSDLTSTPSPDPLSLSGTPTWQSLDSHINSQESVGEEEENSQQSRDLNISPFPTGTSSNSMDSAVSTCPSTGASSASAAALPEDQRDGATGVVEELKEIEDYEIIRVEDSSTSSGSTAMVGTTSSHSLQPFQVNSLAEASHDLSRGNSQSSLNTNYISNTRLGERSWLRIGPLQIGTSTAAVMDVLRRCGCPDSLQADDVFIVPPPRENPAAVANGKTPEKKNAPCYIRFNTPSVAEEVLRCCLNAHKITGVSWEVRQVPLREVLRELRTFFVSPGAHRNPSPTVFSLTRLGNCVVFDGFSVDATTQSSFAISLTESLRGFHISALHLLESGRCIMEMKDAVEALRLANCRELNLEMVGQSCEVHLAQETDLLCPKPVMFTTVLISGVPKSMDVRAELLTTMEGPQGNSTSRAANQARSTRCGNNGQPSGSCKPGRLINTKRPVPFTMSSVITGEECQHIFVYFQHSSAARQGHTALQGYFEDCAPNAQVVLCSAAIPAPTPEHNRNPTPNDQMTSQPPPLAPQGRNQSQYRSQIQAQMQAYPQNAFPTQFHNHDQTQSESQPDPISRAPFSISTLIVPPALRHNSYSATPIRVSAAVRGCSVNGTSEPSSSAAAAVVSTPAPQMYNHQRNNNLTTSHRGNPNSHHNYTNNLRNSTRGYVSRAPPTPFSAAASWANPTPDAVAMQASFDVSVFPSPQQQAHHGYHCQNHLTALADSASAYNQSYPRHNNARRAQRNGQNHQRQSFCPRRNGSAVVLPNSVEESMYETALCYVHNPYNLSYST